MIGTIKLGKHWQSDVLAVTARTPGAQAGSKCSQNTVARPPAPAVAARSPVSFHAAMAASPAVTVRRRCAQITARTGPKLEMAACWASSSVIPTASPAAAVSRSPGAGQQAGIFQPVQGGVDGPLGQVERAPAPVAQRRDDRADLIAKVYPEARFICLVRHPMDVIFSGARNCPWGVSRYGFDPFVAQYPGNTVAAIGAYWILSQWPSVAGAAVRLVAESPTGDHAEISLEFADGDGTSPPRRH